MTHILIPVRISFILGRQIASRRESRRRVLNFLERTLLTCNILSFIIESHVFCLDIFIYMCIKKQWFILSFFIFTPEKQGKLIFRKDKWVFGSTCPAGQVCLKENFEPWISFKTFSLTWSNPNLNKLKVVNTACFCHVLTQQRVSASTLTVENHIGLVHLTTDREDCTGSHTGKSQ